MKSLTLLFFFIFFSSISYADVTWFLSKKESTHKLAVVPSYQRSETLGSIFSGRIFIYPTQKHGLYTSLSADVGNNTRSVKQNTIYWTKSQSEWKFSGEWSQTFDSYYKENSLNRVDVPVLKKWIQAYYLNKDIFQIIHPLLQTGISFEVQNRNESTTEPCILVEAGKQPQLLQDPCQAHNIEELGGTLGWLTRIDTRNNTFDPSSGFLMQTEAKVGKEFKPRDRIFFQIEGKMQLIFSLFKNERWFVQWSGGLSFYDSKDSEDLPYSFQYKLGGINQLRGYLKDRWYGDQYYLLQIELRYPLSKFLQPMLFTDIGQTRFTETALVTYGVGLRVGLPPSYDQKIRVEYGHGKDQSNFIVSFAYPY